MAGSRWPSDLLGALTDSLASGAGLPFAVEQVVVPHGEHGRHDANCDGAAVMHPTWPHHRRDGPGSTIREIT
jgi:hypothetical protein